MLTWGYVYAIGLLGLTNIDNSSTYHPHPLQPCIRLVYFNWTEYFIVYQIFDHILFKLWRVCQVRYQQRLRVWILHLVSHISSSWSIIYKICFTWRCCNQRTKKHGHWYNKRFCWFRRVGQNRQNFSATGFTSLWNLINEMINYSWQNILSPVHVDMREKMSLRSLTDLVTKYFWQKKIPRVASDNVVNLSGVLKWNLLIDRLDPKKHKMPKN